MPAWARPFRFPVAACASLFEQRLARYAAVYFAYFAAVGGVMPFIPLHFSSLGFKGREIGLLLALPPLLASPLTWSFGIVADRTRRPILLLKIALGGVMVALLAVLALHGFAAVAGAMMLYAIFNAPIIALADASTMDEVRRSSGSYAHTRLFGSLGYVVGAFGMGLLAAGTASDGGADPRRLACGLLVLFVGIVALRGIEAGNVGGKPVNVAQVRALLGDRSLVLLLAYAALHWLSLMPYSGFFALYVRGQGHSNVVAGAAMAFGALSETVLMGAAGKRLRRHDPGKLLFVASLLTGFRLVLIACLHDPLLLVLVQVLHAASFGIFYLTCLEVLGRLVPEHLRASGQALFVALVFGVGAGLGALGSGALADIFGTRSLFLFGAAGAVGAALLARRLRLPEPASVPPG